MMTIRDAQQPAGDVSPETEGVPAGVPDALQAQAAEEFASDVAVGRMPSIRTIRARLHVGQPRAQLVRAYLATLAAGYSSPTPERGRLSPGVLLPAHGGAQASPLASR